MSSNIAWVGPMAAVLGAVAAFIAAGVALYVGVRNSKAALRSAEAARISADAALKNADNAGRHKVAASRQEWINKVIDTLSAHHSIEMTRDVYEPISSGDERQLAALRAKLEILLNPEEEDTSSLLRAMDELRAAPSTSDKIQHDQEIIRIARQLLKREWTRIKEELE